MATSKTTLGRIVRLHEYPASALPTHPELAAYQSGGSPADLESFITAALSEGETFLTEYLPGVIKVRSAKRTVPPSRATVQLAEHSIAAGELPNDARLSSGESWFLRSSIHEDEKKAGTGDWEEFEGALLDNHSQHEMDYTPDVFDAHKVLGWDEELDATGRKIGPWEKVEMDIFEMAHKIPAPLANRVFSVLVVKAKNVTTTPHSFIIVQVPVDVSKVPSALYANGRHKQEADTAQKKKDIVMGVYVSIERCQLMSGGHVKWTMATASDAKGNLPLFVQKKAIPDQIAKDVALVVEWLDKQRKGRS